jgi:5-methylcytosine-specific restriction endonuclease McrA
VVDVKTREQYKLIVSKEAEERINNEQCASCGKPKNEWKRTTKFRCCSKECTDKFIKEDYLFGWPDLRLKAFKRDDFTCAHCKKQFQSHELIGDHIKPIALGGEQWELDNIQTLCIFCNKIKTRKDFENIAAKRRTEKHLKKGQIFWDDLGKQQNI